MVFLPSLSKSCQKKRTFFFISLSRKASLSQTLVTSASSVISFRIFVIVILNMSFLPCLRKICQKKWTLNFILLHSHLLCLIHLLRSSNLSNFYTGHFPVRNYPRLIDNYVGTSGDFRGMFQFYGGVEFHNIII